jgi:hypothetical protein
VRGLFNELFVPSALRTSILYCRLSDFKSLTTLESGIDVGQGITVGPGKFVKKNKSRALNKRRA